MEFQETAGQIQPEDFEGVKERLGLPFPDDLAAHYLANNGGMPYPNAFLKEGEYFKINEFLPVKYGDPQATLEATFVDLAERDHFPRDMLPFAIDAAGDYFLYSLGAEAGQIWFFQSDYYDDPERAMMFLAPSFHEFMSQLQADDD